MNLKMRTLEKLLHITLSVTHVTSVPRNEGTRHCYGNTFSSNTSEALLNHASETGQWRSSARNMSGNPQLIPNSSNKKIPRSCVSTTLQTRPLSSVSQSARTHMSHTGCVCALRSLGHGCVQEVKNDINTVRFLTQTARFVS